MTDVHRDLRDPSGGQLAYGGADLELRAADADRDRAAAVLGGALATGRLTSAEHAERLDAVYIAKTMGDLAPLTREEYQAMADGLADSDAPSTGATSLTEWIAGHGHELGRSYANELTRHYR